MLSKEDTWSHSSLAVISDQAWSSLGGTSPWARGVAGDSENATCASGAPGSNGASEHAENTKGREASRKSVLRRMINLQSKGTTGRQAQGKTAP